MPITVLFESFDCCMFSLFQRLLPPSKRHIAFRYCLLLYNMRCTILALSTLLLFDPLWCNFELCWCGTNLVDVVASRKQQNHQRSLFPVSQLLSAELRQYLSYVQAFAWHYLHTTVLWSRSGTTTTNAVSSASETVPVAQLDKDSSLKLLIGHYRLAHVKW